MHRLCLFAGALVALVGPIGAQTANLFEAARAGTPDQILKALKGGGKVTQRDKQGRSAVLIAAASNPDPAVLETLFKAGAKVFDGDGDGATPLVAAVRTNPNPEVVKLLLAKGLDPLTKFAKRGDPNLKFPWELALDNPALRDSEVMALLKKGAYRLADFVGTWVSLRRWLLVTAVIRADGTGSVDKDTVTAIHPRVAPPQGSWSIDLAKGELVYRWPIDGRTVEERYAIAEQPAGGVHLTKKSFFGGGLEVWSELTLTDPNTPIHRPLAQETEPFEAYSARVGLAYPGDFQAKDQTFLPWIESVDPSTRTVQLGGYYPASGYLMVDWDDDVVYHGQEGLDRIDTVNSKAYPWYSFRHQFSRSKVSFSVSWTDYDSQHIYNKTRLFRVDLDTWPGTALPRVERKLSGGLRVVVTDNVVQVVAPGVHTAAEIQKILPSVDALFPDSFDFALVAPWVRSGSMQVGGGNVVGTASPVWNDVAGIGKPLSTGTPTKLRTRLQLYQASSLQSNSGWDLICHELAHTWGNYVLGEATGHNGFSTASGKLGGFDRSVLKDLGGGTYQIDWREHNFTVIGSGPFSWLELYLMGLAAPAEVPSTLVFDNPKLLPFESWDYSKFTAQGSHEVTMNDIVAKYGPRVPAYGKSPTQFRARAVVFVDKELSPVELEILSQNLAAFSDPQPLNYGFPQWEVMNFAAATRGRGTIEFGGLLNLLKK